MKTYAVVFAPEAEDDLIELFEYIAEHGSPVAAAQYTDAIVAYCESLATFAHRGTSVMTSVPACVSRQRAHRGTVLGMLPALVPVALAGLAAHQRLGRALALGHVSHVQALLFDLAVQVLAVSSPRP